MPTNWMDLLKILGPVAGSVVGGALEGDPFQKRKSFEGGDTDPKALLAAYMKDLDGFGEVLGERLKNPRTLSPASFAQSQPGFSKDPGMGEPRKGLDLSKLFGGGASGSGFTRPGVEGGEEPPATAIGNNTKPRPGGKVSGYLEGMGGDPDYPEVPFAPTQNSPDMTDNPFKWTEGNMGSVDINDWKDLIEALKSPWTYRGPRNRGGE